MELFKALNANIFHCGASARKSLSWCLQARRFMFARWEAPANTTADSLWEIWRRRSKGQRKEATIALCKSKWKSHQGRAGPAQHSMQCGSTADASGHECVMPGAKHCFWCKSILFLLATRVLNASPVGEGLRKTTQERSSLTSAMPCVKEIASPELHVEASYGHTQRTDLKRQKKVIYPLVRDAQACKKDVSNGYQCKRFGSFEARWHSMQNWSNKHKSDWIFILKLLPKMVQNSGPRGPNGSQNPFWKPPGRPTWQEDDF